MLSVILISSLLFYIFYIKTDMGFVSSCNGYKMVYAPLWFEVLIVTILVPTFIGIAIYND